MSLKEKLKHCGQLRRVVKSIKNYYEFFCDARDFNKYYLEKSSLQGNQKYRMMLLAHNLEKGMCRNQLRVFGVSKALTMCELLKDMDPGYFEYILGCSILTEWYNCFCEHGWEDQVPSEVIHFINNAAPETTVPAGRETYVFDHELQNEERLCSRRTAREFENTPLRKDDVDFALRCFQAAPTACNRQMCKVYCINDKQAKKMLHDSLLGSGGIQFDTATYFVITYDVAALEFYGERNQGYLNAGLVAMNFVNGLHYRGIGSCFLQWANKRSEDLAMRAKLRLPSSERIAVVLAAGYYKNNICIPCSPRKPVEDIFQIV